MDWRGIEDVLEDLRQREEEADEELRLRYALGSERIELEREQRMAKGTFGRLPR